MTRRQFLNRAYLAALTVGLSNFALASLDYCEGAGGGDQDKAVGDAEVLRAQLDTTRVPIFNPEGFFWLMTYEGQPVAANQVAAYATANVAQSGFVAMHRRCVHLGCSVPWCDTSKWFECPCHGSKYSINGEYRSGPAPRSPSTASGSTSWGARLSSTRPRSSRVRPAERSRPSPSPRASTA